MPVIHKPSMTSKAPAHEAPCAGCSSDYAESGSWNQSSTPSRENTNATLNRSACAKRVAGTMSAAAPRTR